MSGSPSQSREGASPTSEDSLIKINLPSNHFFGFTEEPERKSETELPDFLQESVFKEQALMELLAEINEMNDDENLIEIDISMGSANSQDLRLKQELTKLGNQCVFSINFLERKSFGISTRKDQGDIFAEQFANVEICIKEKKKQIEPLCY